MSPILLGLLFSILVSACFSFIERDQQRERWKYFIKMTIYFFGSILLAGWFMSFFPR